MTRTPITDRPESELLARRGAESIAGGVVSLNRRTDPPISFVRARGSRLWDADGNEYVDYHAAFAPHILGHNDPEVNAAVRAAAEEGPSLMGAGTTPWEIELSERLRACVPSLERVQIANTGSEATAHAVRLSRAFTGREDVVLTLGGYNGWHNDVARQVMPGLDTVGPRASPGEYPFLPASAGIPKSAQRLVHVVNFNDSASVEWVLERHPVACVMTEPVLQNVGVIPPRPGYLRALREICDRHGALLVFDEVKTGFRSALGGYQSRCGVTPDLSVFGKAVANGYPLGVIGGRADVMARFDDPDPGRRVLIAGTYNAHPVPTAAAIATIDRLGRDDGAVYRELEAKGARLQKGLETIFSERGLTVVVSRLGSAFCAYFMDHQPVDWHDVASHHDFDLDRRYRRALVERGIFHFPLACKQGSISAAHSDADLALTLDLTREALKSL
ncbi:MAG: aspartate aminotransferase family protein [Acidobacteria bacterium]|jgi:glutamate-1-semialdehyde 2,1-aminomutase|nr:aspartate aminotransferase family protein [Acidobacteriota bacterium]